MIQLTADFSKAVRPMGKINGMNNGPLMTHMDETAAFKDMGVDFVRFHETHSPMANCIEVPFIFRDFNADENDPANYYFDATDAVIKAAVDANCEIMYRFGMGTESTKPKLFLTVPPDYEKWARICINILRHYNEGWANGFHYGIRYCEIWNEADLKAYWPGEYSEYIKFYCTAAKLIKAYDPNLLVGNCGWAHLYFELPPLEVQSYAYKRNDISKRMENVQFFRDFLEGVIREKAPLDFFAWHFYGRSSAVAQYRVDAVKKLLALYGLQDIEHINTEWSCVHLHRDSAGRWDRSQRDTMKSAIGVLACMLVFQKAGTTKAAYYDADSRSEFFGALTNFDHTPRNHYHSIKAFKMLRQGEIERETAGDTDNVRICASGNGKNAFAAITCEDNDEVIRFKPLGIPACPVRYWILDETRKLVPMRTGRFCGRAIPLKMKANTAVLCEFLLD